MSQQQKSIIAQKFSESLRIARGVRSQAEFARYLGIKHQQTYQAYESGRVPDGETLHQISLKLGVSVDELLTGKSGVVVVVDEKGQTVSQIAGAPHLYPNTPMGRELEESFEYSRAISLLCRQISASQLMAASKAVARDDLLTPNAKLFWMQRFNDEALSKMKSEAETSSGDQ